jgi:hypothetical protein
VQAWIFVLHTQIRKLQDSHTPFVFEDKPISIFCRKYTLLALHLVDDQRLHKLRGYRRLLAFRIAPHRQSTVVCCALAATNISTKSNAISSIRIPQIRRNKHLGFFLASIATPSITAMARYQHQT